MAAPLRGRLRSREAAPEIGEISQEIFSAANLQISQILSGRLVEPQTYRQDFDEFFVLLDGAAELLVGDEIWHLAAGDWGFIPAQTAHALLSAQPGSNWLTLQLA